MSERNDGGPAFPYTPTREEFASEWGPTGERQYRVVPGQECGMTLRDYFAAKAMAALIMEPQFQDGARPAVQVWCDGDDRGYGPERFAYVSYRVADAMLAERSK